jgi:hypothetical protein
MDFEQYIIPDNIEHYRSEKPLQSVHLEFIRHNLDLILDIGEFAAFVAWIDAYPVCMPIPYRSPADALKIAREFYKALKREAKEVQK